VSKINHQEVDNALNQTAKEIGTRFDFRGVGASIAWSGNQAVEIRANSEERANAVLDVFKDKLVRRSVSLKVLDTGEPKASGKEYRLAVGLKEGISQDDSRKISKIIRDGRGSSAEAAAVPATSCTATSVDAHARSASLAWSAQRPPGMFSQSQQPTASAPEARYAAAPLRAVNTISICLGESATSARPASRARPSREATAAAFRLSQWTSLLRSCRSRPPSTIPRRAVSSASLTVARQVPRGCRWAGAGLGRAPGGLGTAVALAGSGPCARSIMLRG
jgi:uncharacterized protein YajQ (UPF0234 family)